MKIEDFSRIDTDEIGFTGRQQTMRSSLASNNALWIALSVRPSVRRSYSRIGSWLKKQDGVQRQKPVKKWNFACHTCELSRKFKMLQVKVVTIIKSRNWDEHVLKLINGLIDLRPPPTNAGSINEAGFPGLRPIVSRFNPFISHERMKLVAVNHCQLHTTLTILKR